jgi:hypothetical protein
MRKMSNNEILMTNQFANGGMGKDSLGVCRRAAARPYRTEPGRDDLPVVRVALEVFLVPLFPLKSGLFCGKFKHAFGRRAEVQLCI